MNKSRSWNASPPSNRTSWPPSLHIVPSAVAAASSPIAFSCPSLDYDVVSESEKLARMIEEGEWEHFCELHKNELAHSAPQRRAALLARGKTQARAAYKRAYSRLVAVTVSSGTLGGSQSEEMIRKRPGKRRSVVSFMSQSLECNAQTQLQVHSPRKTARLSTHVESPRASTRPRLATRPLPVRRSSMKRRSRLPLPGKSVRAESRCAITNSLLPEASTRSIARSAGLSSKSPLPYDSLRASTESERLSFESALPTGSPRAKSRSGRVLFSSPLPCGSPRARTRSGRLPFSSPLPSGSPRSTVQSSRHPFKAPVLAGSPRATFRLGRLQFSSPLSTPRLSPLPVLSAGRPFSSPHSALRSASPRFGLLPFASSSVLLAPPPTEDLTFPAFPIQRPENLVHFIADSPRTGFFSEDRSLLRESPRMVSNILCPSPRLGSLGGAPATPIQEILDWNCDPGETDVLLRELEGR